MIEMCRVLAIHTCKTVFLSRVIETQIEEEEEEVMRGLLLCVAFVATSSAMSMQVYAQVVPYTGAVPAYGSRPAYGSYPYGARPAYGAYPAPRHHGPTMSWRGYGQDYGHNHYSSPQGIMTWQRTQTFHWRRIIHVQPQTMFSPPAPVTVGRRFIAPRRTCYRPRRVARCAYRCRPPRLACNGCQSSAVATARATGPGATAMATASVGGSPIGATNEGTKLWSAGMQPAGSTECWKTVNGVPTKGRCW